MIEVQVVSDLHLENPKAYDVFEITPNAPFLALLGDIGYVTHREEYSGFLMAQLTKFKIVFLVMGNHEPWHSTWDAAKQAMHRIELDIRRERESKSGIGEFVVLDRTCYELEESPGQSLVILGCTLFSKVPAESMETVSFGVNDFYHTEGWTVEDHNAEFERDLAWLNEKVTSLASRARKVLVLTHHSPTLDERATDPKHSKSPIQSGFATDLSGEPCWLSGIVKVWAFGHTHFNCDFEDEKTGKRVISNQRGYYFNQSRGFLESKVIVL
ncbi:Ser/Thr protein phosphatase superfamily [Rostrohypoxylon terebratum]|nr:Ser/Thr protein phosphatase superfamily [Rostrohypoxylon terebratum]